MTLKPGGTDPPTRLTRPQSLVTPLSPGKTNAQPLDDASPNVDDSVVYKAAASGGPLRKQGQENTPPPSRLPAGTDPPHQHNHAAVSRQQLYEPKERTVVPVAKKFNTSRALTPEEREILNKPHVKRLVNVTQLCRCPEPN